MNTTALVRCSCIVLMFLHASVLNAQLSWDLSSTTGIQVTGDATWDTTLTNWNNGSTNVAWNNATNATTTAVFGVASPTATTGGTITVSGTINLGGMKFLPFASIPTPFSFTFAGSGTLAFANDAVIELGDVVSSGSTGNQFVNLNTVVTGNNITIQRATGASSGAFQYLRFSGNNTALTGTLTIKSTSTAISNFILISSAAAQAALSRVVIESGSVYAINGASSNYAVPITLGGTGQGNGAIRIDASSITISGPLTLTSTALLNSNSGTTGTIVSGAIGETGGSQGLQRSAVLTSSTISFTGASTYTGVTTLGRSGAVGGVTILDFSAASAPTTDIFYNGVTAGGLSFVGSSNAGTFLNLVGKAATANVQHFGAVTTAAGTLGVVTLTSGTGGSMDLSLGTITRTGTGLLAFIAPASGSVTTTSTGFLGPWVTYRDTSGVTSWAQVSGGVLVGGYAGDLAYSSGKAISAVSGYASSKNLTVSNASGGNVTLTGATTDINTISMSDPWLARTVNLGANILRLGAAGGVQLAAGAQNLTISGGTLTAGGASNTAGQVILTNNSSTALLQVDANILANGTGAATLIVNGVSGSKTILTGSNVLGGGAIIASGALEIRNSNALGSTGTVAVFDGAALQLSGGITLARTLSVGGGGVASDGVIRNLSGNNTIGGLVTTTQPVRIQSDAGTLTFFNTNATTNSITAGSSSYTVTFSGAGDIVVNSRLNLTSQTTTKEGTGRLTLGGDNSVITGAFAVTAGVLRVTNVNALGNATGATTVSSGATLELAYASDTTLAEPITFDGAGYNSTGAIRNVSGNNTLSGTLSVGTTALTTITADGGTTLTISGTLRSGATAAGTRTVTLGGSGTINITGAITNGTTPATYMTAISKADSGTVNLRAASTFAPATTSATTLATILATVRGGVLNFDFANAAATTNLIVSSNNLSLNGGTLQMTGKDGTTNLQGVISTTLTAGRSALVVTSGVGGTMNVALGTILRAAASGSATNITLPASGSITTTTLNTNGILNGGLVVGGNSWATSAATQTTSVSWVNTGDTVSIGNIANGTQVAFTGTAPGGLTAGVSYYVVNSNASSFQVALSDVGTAIALTNDGTTGQMNQAGAITGLTSYSSTFTSNANVDLAAGTTTQGTATINSLRFNAASGSTLTLSGNLTSASGGLLVTSAVTGNVTIQSDSSTARTLTNSSSDFNIYNYGTGNLTIASTITVTGTAFTTSGPGLITFAGLASTSATQVRVTEGTLSIVGNNRFTGTTDPTFTIGSVGVAAKLIFGNGASTGAESFTAINVLGTTSSLVGGGTGLYTISMQNTGTNDWRNLMIGGTGTNENNLSLEAFSAGTIQLGAANTYAGRTNIGRSTFEVSVLANAGTASSLGTGSQVSTIDMNDTNSTNATVSTLRYVGTADAVTDRAIRMYTDGQPMPSLTAVLENNGTGSVKFTSAFTAAGSTTLARTFRLSGTNTGANEIVSMTDGPSSTVTLNKAGVGRWTLTGNSTYTGGTTVSAGTLQLGNGGTAGMVGGGDVAISSGATLVTNRSDSFSINNNITGAGSVIIGNASGGATTLTSNANTYSGGTTVNSGTLVFTNVSGSATGSGTVTVTSSATLAGTGRIAPAAGNPVLVQGTLSVGQISGTAADMEITTSGAGTLFMDTTSVMLMDLVSGAGSGTLNTSTAADMLVLGGTMTLNSGSTLRVQNLNGLSGWVVGDAWKLIDWNTLSGTASGTFTTLDLPVLGAGLQWDSSALYSTGVLSVIAVPEPSRLWVLAAGFFAVLIRRRRC